MASSRKVVITCAVTGAIHTPSMSPALPLTAEEIADAAIGAAEAGAAIVHLHARDPKDGLGLRWSFMGPFETIDLNAPGGVADYAARFGPLMGGITEEQAPYDYDRQTVEKVAGERRAALPLAGIEDRSAWRDRRLMALAAHKRRAAQDIGE